MNPLIYLVGFYIGGFLFTFGILMFLSSDIIDRVKTKIESPKTEKDLDVYEFFRNISESEGESKANFVFYFAIFCFIFLASIIWPYFLYKVVEDLNLDIWD